jgi:hypothetical protein
MFSMWFVPRLYNEEELWLRESRETAVRRVGGCCEMASSLGVIFFLFGLWDYWHCGHSWPIVPASGDSEDDCGEEMECRLAGETEVLGENLPQRHFCPSQNPTCLVLFRTPDRSGGKPATNRLSYGAAFFSLGVSWSNEWVVRQSPTGKNVSTEAEDPVGVCHQATTVEDTAYREDLVHAVVNCRVCELPIAL